jgi:hypothetical protein
MSDQLESEEIQKDLRKIQEKIFGVLSNFSERIAKLEVGSGLESAGDWYADCGFFMCGWESSDYKTYSEASTAKRDHARSKHQGDSGPILVIQR